MKTMLLVIAAFFASFYGRPAEALVSYGDNLSRSQCVLKLSETKFFSDPSNYLTVARAFKPGYSWLKESRYTLRPEGIFEELQTNNYIWTTKDFRTRGDTSGRIEVDTQQAQTLLIAKALEILTRTLPTLTREQAADVYEALLTCAKLTNAVGPIDPDRPHSLYSRDTQDLGTKAADLIFSLPLDVRPDITGTTSPKRR